MKYRVTKIKTMLETIFRVDLYKVRKEREDGSLFGEFNRVNINRGDAVAMLLYNPEAGTVLMVRQFRLAKYSKGGNGLLWEIPAGMMEDGEKPEEVAIRETLEETGYAIENPRLLRKIIPAPGVMNEFIYIFYAEISRSQKIESGGGVAEEGEYLEVFELPLSDIDDMLERGKIEDAKTLVALCELREIRKQNIDGE